ncbi:MAG: tRNA (guanosine(37)-N1)-methyltransferase TrmD [bacterium]
MRFVVLTLFPDFIRAYAADGVLGRAVEQGVVTVDAVDIREHTTDKYRSVDDVPFGGGAGMVMKPEPVARAIEAAGPVARRVLLTPSGRPFTQADAVAWSKLDSLLLLCGRYEGVDGRIEDDFVDDAVSIGDYVLSGGELGALVVLDATMRLLPGVLGNAESLDHESYTEGLLEHPHYTRPADWRGRPVPEVLLSGHHARIADWRRRASLQRTARLRPDLLKTASLTPRDERILLELGFERRGEPT